MADRAFVPPTEDSKWRLYDEGRTIGRTGSEDGTIIRDEEHIDGALITLERQARHIPFAITCGVYGWMVHTRYYGTIEAAQYDFDEMKIALAEILDLIPYKDDPEAEAKFERVYPAIKAFVDRLPT